MECRAADLNAAAAEPLPQLSSFHRRAQECAQVSKVSGSLKIFPKCRRRGCHASREHSTTNSSSLLSEWRVAAAARRAVKGP